MKLICLIHPVDFYEGENRGGLCRSGEAKRPVFQFEIPAFL